MLDEVGISFIPQSLDTQKKKFLRGGGFQTNAERSLIFGCDTFYELLRNLWFSKRKSFTCSI